MNILQNENQYRMLANTADCDNSPYPVTFRTLCEHHEQEHIRGARRFHQILFVVEGEGELTVGGKKYSLKRGSAFFTEECLYAEYLDRGGFVSAFLTVTGDAVGALSRSLSDGGFLFVENLDVEKYLSMLRKIRHVCETDMDQAELSSLCYAFFVDFLSKRKSGAPEYLESAVKYIERNLSGKLTLEDIARNACVSVSKLSHGFKTFFGISVFNFVIEKRLQYARNLVLSPGKVLTKDIANACGFLDVGYFCRAYKRRFGSTPKSDGV